MKRNEVVDQLRAMGYDGPVSYTKERLLEIVQSLEAPAAGQPLQEPPSVPPATTGRYIREPQYENLNRLLEFRVTGEVGAWFNFHALVTDQETGRQWVDCYGGTKRHASTRSFFTDKIIRRNGVIITRSCRRVAKQEETS